MKTWSITLMAAVIAAAGYLLYDTAQPVKAPHVLHEPPAAAESARRAPIAIPVLRPASRAADDDAPDLTAVAEPATSKPEPEQAPSLQPEEVRDRLEAYFHEDTAGSSWSHDAAQTIEQRLPAILPLGSMMRSVECRTRFCRIETAHAGLDQFIQFTDSAFKMPDTKLWNGGYFATVLAEPIPGETVVAIAYLARDGQELITPDILAGQER